MPGEALQELVATGDWHGLGGVGDQAQLMIGKGERLHLITIIKIAVPPVTTSSSASAATALRRRLVDGAASGHRNIPNLMAPSIAP
jgi:hypothetical protein